jgi:hypothetical protein
MGDWHELGRAGEDEAEGRMPERSLNVCLAISISGGGLSFSVSLSLSLSFFSLSQSLFPLLRICQL